MTTTSKQKRFYNIRTRHGQFYARKKYLEAQATGRLAVVVFIILAVLSCFFN